MNAFKHMRGYDLDIGGGSDSPMTPINPMYGVWPLEKHHDPAQRWSRPDALRLFTECAARLAGKEPKKGRLVPGYDADFAVFGVDPLLVDDVRSLTPEQTYVRGRIVHSE
jgi:predicted amidohydrolase YtcJ